MAVVPDGSATRFVGMGRARAEVEEKADTKHDDEPLMNITSNAATATTNGRDDAKKQLLRKFILALDMVVWSGGREEQFGGENGGTKVMPRHHHHISYDSVPELIFSIPPWKSAHDNNSADLSNGSRTILSYPLNHGIVHAKQALCKYSR